MKSRNKHVPWQAARASSNWWLQLRLPCVSRQQARPFCRGSMGGAVCGHGRNTAARRAGRCCSALHPTPAAQRNSLTHPLNHFHRPATDLHAFEADWKLYLNHIDRHISSPWATGGRSEGVGGEGEIPISSSRPVSARLNPVLPHHLPSPPGHPCCRHIHGTLDAEPVGD